MKEVDIAATLLQFWDHVWWPQSRNDSKEAGLAPYLRKDDAVVDVEQSLNSLCRRAACHICSRLLRLSLAAVDAAAVVVEVKRGNRWTRGCTHGQSVFSLVCNVACQEVLVMQDVIQGFMQSVERDKLVCTWYTTTFVEDSVVVLEFLVDDDAGGAFLFKLLNRAANFINASCSINECEKRRSVDLDDLQLVESASTLACARMSEVRAQECDLLLHRLCDLSLVPEDE